MTNKSSWKEIKDRFTILRVPNIEVASIPKVKGAADKSHSSASVSFWWEHVEQRSLELALKYLYVCYGYYELLWRNIYSFNCMGFHGKERG